MTKARSKQKRDSKKLQLPPPGILHWDVRSKAAVVIGIRSGLITREEACNRYLLSMEELATWETLFDEYGTPGLLLKTIWQRRRQRARQSQRRKP